MQRISNVYQILYNNIKDYAVAPKVQICRVRVPLFVHLYIAIVILFIFAEAKITTCESSFGLVRIAGDNDTVLNQGNNRSNVWQSGCGFYKRHAEES